MITQKQIKEWIPSALDTFRSVMPPIPTSYPEIHIASATTLRSVRESLVAQTRSLNPNMKEPYTSMMETIHGEGGTAILIYQKYCPESRSEFNHALWHELGHFYAVATETEPFSHFAGQGLDPNRIRQTGYWVWNEFVAECISNHISTTLLDKEDEKNDHGWREASKSQKHWRQPYLRLQGLIQSAYNTYPGSFYEYDLAFYYAALLTDPITTVFVDGALNNELTVWSPDKWAYVPMKPDSIEPTALSMIPRDYGDKLLEIMDLLEDKVAEDEFWKVDGAFLDQLGTLITELNDMKGFARLRGITSSLSPDHHWRG